MNPIRRLAGLFRSGKARVEFIPSHAQYKRQRLSRQLALVAFTVCTLYILLDLYTGIYYTWPYEGACAILLLFSYILSRLGKFNTSNILLGISINLTVFVFSSSEELWAGLSMLYIAVCIGALAVFGYERRKTALAFIGMSIGLFILQLVSGIEFIPRVQHAEQYLVSNYVVNFFTCLVSSLLIIYSMVKINYRTESSLRSNEEKMEAQNRELMKINSELDRFVYSTSHDLRAPLSSTHGLIQIIEMTEDREEIRKCVAMLKGRIESLDKFIIDIAQYARNSQSEVTPSHVPIKKAVREVLESLGFYPGASEVRTELSIPDDLALHTDATRLRMVLTNLVSNGFKYRDVNKKERFLKISANGIGNQVEIQIEDNGIGIPQEYLNRIFDMFFQAHEKSVGSGLGLYIVKETVEKLRGTIGVKSEVGQGTHFTVTLPSQIVVS
jgi:signal transduction histidine kinase